MIKQLLLTLRYLNIPIKSISDDGCSIQYTILLRIGCTVTETDTEISTGHYMHTLSYSYGWVRHTRNEHNISKMLQYQHYQRIHESSYPLIFKLLHPLCPWFSLGQVGQRPLNSMETAWYICLLWWPPWEVCLSGQRCWYKARSGHPSLTSTLHSSQSTGVCRDKRHAQYELWLSRTKKRFK